MKTRELVKHLKTSYHKITAAIRGGKIKAPAKDCSGDFVWSAEDIAAARRALAVDRRRTRTRKGASA